MFDARPTQHRPRRVGFALSDAELDKIDSMAAQRGLTRSDLLRTALQLLDSGNRG